MTYRRFIGFYALLIVGGAWLLMLCFALRGQNTGPITSGRLAWYDYSCKCPTGQLTCATCWKYLRLPPGARIDPDPSGASDGILWAVEPLAAPGTNPGQIVRFNPDDFSVTHASPDVQDVSVIWATSIEGGIDTGQKVWSLPGFKTKPVGCMVFRDGILLSFARNDYTYLEPIAPSADWNLQFTQASEKTDYIVAHCLKGP